MMLGTVSEIRAAFQAIANPSSPKGRTLITHGGTRLQRGGTRLTK